MHTTARTGNSRRCRQDDVSVIHSCAIERLTHQLQGFLIGWRHLLFRIDRWSLSPAKKAPHNLRQFDNGHTMNVTTNPLDALLPVISVGKLVSKAPTVQDGGFLDAMKQALATTSQLQSESGRLSREVTFGNPTVSLEETMLAGVKSNIAFQATLQSRNRIVQAYTDVMNMQV